MKDETAKWIQFAEENLNSAKILLESQLYNPCLQNTQQAIEKFLKAILIESSLLFRKTHSIRELISILSEKKIKVNISEDNIDLLDSIYLPSKYPLGSALPDYNPGPEVCTQCITIAEEVKHSAIARISR